MMGHGFDPALSEGSLKPPIFLTSTFVFENAAAGKRHFVPLPGNGSTFRGLRSDGFGAAVPGSS